jgi:hypothetical protein
MTRGTPTSILLVPNNLIQRNWTSALTVNPADTSSQNVTKRNEPTLNIALLMTPIGMVETVTKCDLCNTRATHAVYKLLTRAQVSKLLVFYITQHDHMTHPRSLLCELTNCIFPFSIMRITTDLPLHCR